MSRKYQNRRPPSLAILSPPKSFTNKDFYWAEYCPLENKIFMNPFLLLADVPSWVVSYVWEHEFLHWKLGSTCHGEWHDKTFKKEERENPARDAAEAWLEDYLAKLKKLHSKKKSSSRVR